MEKDTKYSQTSIKNKILVSFILVILVLVIGIKLGVREGLHISLANSGVAMDIREKVDSDFTVISSGLVILSIFLTVIIAIALSKYLTKPINELRIAVEKAEKGSFEINIDPKLKDSNDEVGQLAVAFSGMVDALKNSHAGLEGKVFERTKELEASKKTLEGKIEEIDNMNKMMVGRELRMMELKEQIKKNENK